MPLTVAHFPDVYQQRTSPHVARHIRKITEICPRAGRAHFLHGLLAAPRLRVRKSDRNVLLFQRRRLARRLREVRHRSLNRVGIGSDRVALGVQQVLEESLDAKIYNPPTPLSVPIPVRKS